MLRLGYVIKSIPACANDESSYNSSHAIFFLDRKSGVFRAGFLFDHLLESLITRHESRPQRQFNRVR